MAHSRKYSITGQVTTSSQATLLSIVTPGTVEPSIFYLGIGSNATPADNSLEWFMRRHTAGGTGTAQTPAYLGNGTLASLCTGCLSALTVEPTYTANTTLWRLGLNQRAAHSLVFDPEGCPTSISTANAGIGIYVSHASATPTVSGTIHFRE